MFLLLEPEKEKMKLNLEITNAGVRITPSGGVTAYVVWLSCDSPDGCTQLDLQYGSMEKMMDMYDGIRLLMGSGVTYNGIAELEAAALSALDGGAL